MKDRNPDTLELASSEELHERQRATGEIGDGKTVFCVPDPWKDPESVQQVSRAICLASAYPGCQVCPHHSFELIFEVPEVDDWVMCPRWKKEDNGPPSFYTIARLSECRAKPFAFCPKCPSREELVQLQTDKKKQGWLERYRKMTREG